MAHKPYHLCALLKINPNLMLCFAHLIIFYTAHILLCVGIRYRGFVWHDFCLFLPTELTDLPKNELYVPNVQMSITNAQASRCLRPESANFRGVFQVLFLIIFDASLIAVVFESIAHLRIFRVYWSCGSGRARELLEEWRGAPESDDVVRHGCVLYALQSGNDG